MTQVLRRVLLAAETDGSEAPTPGRSTASSRTGAGSAVSCNSQRGASREEPVSGSRMHGTLRGLPYSAQASARPSGSRMPLNGGWVDGSSDASSYRSTTLCPVPD
jgi:hypothetical protein